MRTGRSIQRGIFLKSLRDQFDSMDQSCGRDRLRVLASQYLDDGLSSDETVELLVIDGFDHVMAASCVSGIIIGAEPPAQSDQQWEVEFEDQDGSKVAGSDIGISVKASSETEAWEQAESQAASVAPSMSVSRIVRI